MRGVRSTVNKLTKEGYQFTFLQPPFDQNFLATLQAISASWLHGRKEKGFSLRFFSVDYLQWGPIVVVKNQDNEIVTFANIMLTYTKNCDTTVKRPPQVVWTSSLFICLLM
jgi:phosphatidylglycerol lysyltransferase